MASNNIRLELYKQNKLGLVSGVETELKSFLGDIFPLCDTVTFEIIRNQPGTLRVDVSVRAMFQVLGLQFWDYCTPIATAAYLSRGDTMIWGGFLSATPTANFGESIDAVVSLEFVSWLGYLAGLYPSGNSSYNDNFDYVFAGLISTARGTISSAGGYVPINMSATRNIPVVQGTIEKTKSLLAYATERTDNTEGTGEFIVRDNPDGTIQMKKYGGYLVGGAPGTPVSLFYPSSSPGDIVSIEVEPVSDLTTAVVAVGAEVNGAALSATRYSYPAARSMGYWASVLQRTDISNATTLGGAASALVANKYPMDAQVDVVVSLDGDNLVLDTADPKYLWIDALVSIVADFSAEYIGVDFTQTRRVDKVSGTIDKTGHMGCRFSLSRVEA